MTDHPGRGGPSGDGPEPDDLPPLVTTDDPHASRDPWRPLRRTLTVGGVLAVAGAAAVGLLGSGGRGSLAALFVGASLVVSAGGMIALIGALRDELRGRRVGRARLVVAVALLLAAPVCLVLAAGAAGTA